MSEPIDSAEERVSERVAAAYRQTPPPRPAARERLEHALAALPSPSPARRRDAWSALRARPFAAAAALAATLLVGIALGRGVVPGRERVPAPAAVPVEAAAASRVVQFVLVAPRASRVAVVGDFNGWDPSATPMRRAAGVATWTANVTVPAGRHAYAFVMDGGQWISDPLAPLDPVNEFGFRNSVLLVEEPAS